MPVRSGSLRRILLTRPEPGASATRRLLAERGFEPLVLPLSKIVSLGVKQKITLTEFSAIAVTSANAVRHAPPELLLKLAELPTYAVGEATAAACRSAGLNVANIARGDAESLKQLIAQHLPDEAAVLVLCGRVRRDILENGLLAHRYRPVLIETYDTLATTPELSEINTVLNDQPVDVVLLYSAFATQQFIWLLESLGSAELFADADFIAISKRVSDALPEGLGKRIFIATEPNEGSMLSYL